MRDGIEAEVDAVMAELCREGDEPLAAELAFRAADWTAPAGERADALVELVSRAVPYPGDLAALRVELVALILEGEVAL